MCTYYYVTLDHAAAQGTSGVQLDPVKIPRYPMAWRKDAKRVQRQMISLQKAPHRRYKVSMLEPLWSCYSDISFPQPNRWGWGAQVPPGCGEYARGIRNVYIYRNLCLRVAIQSRGNYQSFGLASREVSCENKEPLRLCKGLLERLSTFRLAGKEASGLICPILWLLRLSWA